MKPIVSIVIPIFNSEEYLSVCIESILKQTFTSWEAILIDDNSTDNSAGIAYSFTRKDKRIHYLKNQKSGVSSARNYGIDNSQGEYIIFLDSDDFWISDNCLEQLIEKITLEKLDLVRGEYIWTNEKGKIVQSQTIKFNSENKKAQKFCFSSYELLTKVINGEYFIWLFAFKKSLFQNIRFDENKKFQEDTDLLIRLLCKELRCGYTSTPFYAYRQRTTSSISSTVCLTKIYNSFSLCSVFWNYSQQTEDKRLTDEYIYLGIMMYYWTLETAASNTYYNHFEEIQTKANLIQLHKEVKNWMKKLPNRKFPIQLYVTPHNGARLYRLRWRIGKILRNLHLLK